MTETICPLAQECLTKDQEAALAWMRKAGGDWKYGGLIKLKFDPLKAEGDGRWEIVPLPFARRK